MRASWAVVVLALFLAAAAALFSGWHYGGRVGTARTNETETRIMAWIVERNPKATVKDFNGFPRALIEESTKAGIDVRIVMAIIDKESGFKPDAVGRAGEIGLMQVMPKTAEIIAKNKGWMFPEPWRVVLQDPKTNIRFGLAYLKDQVDKFGMGPTALRAFNRGPAQAKQHRPHDRYAEDIGLRLVNLVQEVRND